MKNKILFLILVLAATSCVTYEKCARKFGNTVSDTIRVTIPVSVLVPRDSVITSFKTDTTYLYKEVQQGRAKVIFERTHTITTVQAQCDTITVTKLVPVKVPAKVIKWGVAPWYKTAFLITASFLLMCLGLLAILFFHKPNYDLQTAKN